eukprot:Plantae.Rhodophyta-Palmaria_palmata.ctg27298.p2 GENE.Plantae.Rhodophyta-Palmaria_palmata.ctg27298~~Plantae.Rhodophyta-Palmaria_palmata.ctg27298.p2  ORF type:complete len:106 (+),score=35.71 Plantae.Rhodophyta-Palmaria_palmata.ctg27298:85-402(+)
MDGLLNKVAGAAGVKADPGESIEQTMKEKAVEEALEDKVEELAGKKAAENKQVQKGIEMVADAIGDKVPTSMLAAGAMGSKDSDDKKGGGAADLMGAAAGLLGKK